MNSPRTVRCVTCGGLHTPTQSVVPPRALLLRELATHLVGCHDDAWRFFRAVLEPEKRYRTVGALALDLGVSRSSLLSRFVRAGLPSPKRYLAYAGFVRIVEGLQEPRASLTTVAYALEYSSPQSMGRSIRRTLGMTGEELRDQLTPESIVTLFCDRLILPFLESWKSFTPMVERPRQSAARRIAA